MWWENLVRPNHHVSAHTAGHATVRDHMTEIYPSRLETDSEAAVCHISPARICQLWEMRHTQQMGTPRTPTEEERTVARAMKDQYEAILYGKFLRYDFNWLIFQLRFRTPRM
jgi:hypothetical protein